MTDAELVLLVRNGDKEAYTHLVERYRNAIYGLAYHQVQNFEDARDVAQETFIHAYLHLAQLREPGNFAPWLRQVTTNQCRMWHRRHRVTEGLESSPPVACDMRQLETRLTLQQALHCLSADSRLTLTLFYFQQHSLHEIAQFLGVPVTTVKSRLRNARTRLQKEMLEMVEDTLQPATLPVDFATQVMQMLDGGTIWALAFAPDSRTLVSGNSDKTVRIWDAVTGALLSTLSGHEKAVDAVAFASDGKTIASGGRDKTVRLWDVHGGALRRTLDNQGRVDACAFAPDGKTIAATSAERTAHDQFASINSRVCLWDVATGALRCELETLRRVEPLAPGQPQNPEPGGMYYSVAFAPDGSTLATGNALTYGGDIIGGEVKLWDVQTGERRTVLEVADFGVQPVAFSPDGQLLAAGCTRPGSPHKPHLVTAEIRLWSVPTGALLHTIKEADGWYLKSLAFAPDGKVLAVGRMQTAGGEPSHCDLRLWELPTGKLRQTLDDGRTGKSVIAFAPNGDRIASAGAGHRLMIWRVTS